MNSKDYWVKRTLQVKQSQIDKDEQLSKKLAAEYDALKKSIDDEFAKFYGRYAASEGISMAKAKKLLTKAELENFRMSLDEFKEKALEGGYDKELNEIYLRSRISRLQALQTQLDMMVQALYQDQQAALSEHLATCYQDTYYQTVYQIQDMSGVFSSSFAHIDTAALDKALTTPWLESDFSSRVWNNRDKLIDELHTVLAQAFVRGDALDKVSRLLAKRMDVSKSRADALVQTEAGHIAEQATLDGYHECGTEEYRYLATLDIKTCGICGPLDDRVFPVSEAQPGVNYPLMHTRCRCTTVPEVPYQSETRMSRDPVTGKSIRVERMSFQEWHKKYVEDVSEAAIAEKKHKNQYADKKQYQKYVDLLGRKNVAKSFDSFQNIKYTDSEKWKQLQRAYKDKPLRDRIQSDEQPKTIESGKQGKHIKGHNNYIEGRSYLTISEKKAQKLVDRYAGTGELRRNDSGKWVNKEFITAPDPVGYWVDPMTGKQAKTCRFAIHYSKKGVHIVPVREGEKQ